MVLVAPERYLDYARWAIAPYRAFIEGPFAAHPAWWVLPIAAGQLACGLMLALGHRGIGRLGALGAMIFLLSITPLGVGAGFPTPVVMALAVMLVWRSMPDRTLMQELRGARERLERPSPAG